MDAKGERGRAIRALAMRIHFFRALQVEPLEERTLLAAELLADINQTPLGLSGATAGSSPTEITLVNSVAFFAANDGVHGTELWKTDGTAAGTVMVKDIYPGAGSSSPKSLANVNGVLYFSANDGTNGYELWKSDGTEAGTTMVADSNPGSGGISPSNLTNVGGMLFFSAKDSDHGTELWTSNGTATGTARLSDIHSGIGGSYPADFTNVSGTLFFTANDGSHGPELWKSDGTAAGTVLVKDILLSDPRIDYLTNANGTLFFVASDLAHGREVWKSDGTEAGTMIVKDVNAGRRGCYPYGLVNIGGLVLFGGFDDETTPGGLWTTDGTEAGTVQIAASVPFGSNDLVHARYFTNVNGTVFFTAGDPAYASEGLWKTDGTSGGTVRLTGTAVGTPIVDISNLTNANGTLYFTADGDSEFGFVGREPWSSNGTIAGTAPVRDIAPGTANSLPQFVVESFVPVAGHVVFAADDSLHGREVWITTSNTAPSFTKGADQIVDEDDGIVTVMGWATKISPGPPEEAYQRVAFTVTWDNSELFNNVSIDPLGNLTIDLVPDAHGAAQLIVVLKDDGGTTEGGSDTSAQTFRIQVNSVNDPPSFNMNSGELVYPEDYGDVAIEQWATFISPGPANETNQALTFVVSNDNNDLFSFQPTIDLTGKLTFRTADNANGSATISVVAKDDGGTANGGSDTSLPHTFTVTVTPVNDPPSFVKGDDQTVLEDCGGVSIEGWATDISPGPPDEILQQVHFFTDVSNFGLFDVLPTVHPDGTLTFTPAANANGASAVMVTAIDDGDPDSSFSATQTFFITVKAVNDPPAFTAGAEQMTTDESGEQIVPGWATNISAGPPDESGRLGISGGPPPPPGQALKFIVTTENGDLFSVPPAIDADGQLTFTPRPNARGQATLSVVLMDDGGTADGGIDTSPPQTLIIDVAKPFLWRNTLSHLDINGDGHVAANDALAAINFINGFGTLNDGKVPAWGTMIGGLTVDAGKPFGFLDSNGDNFVAPNDALDVINAINAGQGGEGEGGAARELETVDGGQQAFGDELMTLLAGDVAGQGLSRRRESVK